MSQEPLCLCDAPDCPPDDDGYVEHCRDCPCYEVKPLGTPTARQKAKQRLILECLADSEGTDLEPEQIEAVAAMLAENDELRAKIKMLKQKKG